MIKNSDPLLPLFERRPMTGKVVEVYHRARSKFPGQLTPIGAIFDPALTFDQWVHAGETLLVTRDMASWALGDWQIYGRKRFGVRHAQALSDYSRETLHDYRRVCKAFPMARRRPGLSFGHHRAVYRLAKAEQDELLGLCEKNDWTRRQLRDELARRRGQPAGLTTFLQVGEPGGGRTNASAEKVLCQKNLIAAARFLSAEPMGNIPKKVALTLRAVLEQHSKFLAVLEAAEISIASGVLTPALKTAVEAAVRGS